MKVRLRSAALALTLTLGVGTAACGGGSTAAPRTTLPSGLQALSAQVPDSALNGVVDMVDLITLTCRDLPTDRSAAQATLVAAEQVGLVADDDRWLAATQTLTDGLAQHPSGQVCKAELAGWMAAALVPVTIPTSTPSTTTTPLVDQLTELAKLNLPTVSADTFRKVKPGMTLTEVRDLLGSSGSPFELSQIGPHRDELIRWPAKGQSFAAITIQFRDWRVLAATTSGDR